MATSGQVDNVNKSCSRCPGTGPVSLVSTTNEDRRIPENPLEHENTAAPAFGTTLLVGEQLSTQPKEESMESVGQGTASQSNNNSTENQNAEQCSRNENPVKLPVWAYAAAAARSEFVKDRAVKMKQDGTLQETNVFSRRVNEKPAGARRYRTMPAFRKLPGRVEILTGPPGNDSDDDEEKGRDIVFLSPDPISDCSVQFNPSKLCEDSTGEKVVSPHSPSTTATSKSNGGTAAVVVGRVIPKLDLTTSKIYLESTNGVSCRNLCTEQRSMQMLQTNHNVGTKLPVVGDFVPIVENMDDLFPTGSVSERASEGEANLPSLLCNTEANSDRSTILVEDFLAPKPNGCLYNLFFWNIRQPTV